MYPTKNDLSESTRITSIETLNLRLADAIVLQTQVKQAHWNVKGPHFIGLHKLFDEISEAMLEYIDLIAERVVQLGGVAEGTARVAVQRTQLKPYPLDIATGKAHCEALSSALATFGQAVREGIDEADRAGDKDTSDLYTEVSRGTDQWLWFCRGPSASRRIILWKGTNWADGDALFVAGTKAPPGLYRRIDGRREITLETKITCPPAWMDRSPVTSASNSGRITSREWGKPRSLPAWLNASPLLLYTEWAAR